MAKDQPGVAGVVIAFKARPLLTEHLTPLDRLDVCHWREAARLAGYDRMFIHEREDGEDGSFGNFLCLHRAGEAWSRWGFARKGNTVSVWCCLTGVDIGDYPSLSAAFEAVLPCVRADAGPPKPRPAVVTNLLPRLRPSTNRLGSAA